jgi:hypothetical protein
MQLKFWVHARTTASKFYFSFFFIFYLGFNLLAYTRTRLHPLFIFFIFYFDMILSARTT